MGERRGRFKSRNFYKGPIDKDNGGGMIECGRWGWVGQGRVLGGKWGKLKLNNNKKIKETAIKLKRRILLLSYSLKKDLHRKYLVKLVVSFYSAKWVKVSILRGHYSINMEKRIHMLYTKNNMQNSSCTVYLLHIVYIS